MRTLALCLLLLATPAKAEPAFHLVFSTNPIQSGRDQADNRYWLQPDTLYCIEPDFADDRCLSNADVWRGGSRPMPCQMVARGRASHDTLYVHKLVLHSMYRNEFTSTDVTWWLCGRGR